MTDPILSSADYVRANRLVHGYLLEDYDEIAATMTAAMTDGMASVVHITQLLAAWHAEEIQSERTPEDALAYIDSELIHLLSDDA